MKIQQTLVQKTNMHVKDIYKATRNSHNFVLKIMKGNRKWKYYGLIMIFSLFMF